MQRIVAVNNPGNVPRSERIVVSVCSPVRADRYTPLHSAFISTEAEYNRSTVGAAVFSVFLSLSVIDLFVHRDERGLVSRTPL